MYEICNKGYKNLEFKFKEQNISSKSQTLISTKYLTTNEREPCELSMVPLTTSHKINIYAQK